MMMRNVLVVLLFLVLLVLALVLGARSLPWWALALIGLALAFGLKFAMKRILTYLFVAPFRMKGVVLKSATIQVHSVAPASTPPGDPNRLRADPSTPDQEPISRQYFDLDVTIHPDGSNGKFPLWEPGELRLVRPEAKTALANDQDNDACVIKQVQIEQAGQFQPEEGYKYEGPQRLRLLLAVHEGVRQLKFSYYFEEFGEVRLPVVAASAAAA
jgi:hypothetical protein